MKTLVLVRHAKSSWKDSALADIDRPLSPRGKRDAPRMASRFAARDIDVELVICSPSKRTRRTAKMFCGEIGYEWNEVQLEERLYEASRKQILEVIREVDDDIDALMLFGHNPGFTDLVNSFAPRPIDNVPTSGVVIMTFDTTRWKHVPKLEPKDFSFDYPKKANGAS